MPAAPKDRFDDIPHSRGRVGAHRAENPRVGGWTTFFWAVGAAAVLMVVGVFATLIADGRIELFPAAVETAAPVETVPPVVDTSYSVLVLNGTPEEGVASEVKEALVAEGWTDGAVVASNASDREYPETTVYYAAEEAEGAARGLAGIVGASEVVLNADYPLPDTSATQLTVVVGVDSVEESGEE
ncbi:LytR C-terminal domain-containing protein [Microbacterium sp. LRZ72]|uniref:LytR C-terminal domain-containing protein n=1 Tax=Microbacterium sp. LRZ72 TaxID=2942481 RepID=UPI0029B0D2BE|nr:LytR C-terminal domain-containing protein [Microbacterium sp. LRZ72]MDX2375938.1 LytR C-terminal domain-containing protein [Microbacterium sp. LRZ72]